LPSRARASNTITPSTSVAEYLKLHKPRVKNDPFSAPLFDSLREVKSYPEPNCLMSMKTTPAASNAVRCKCYSQQATQMNIDTPTCLNYIANGLPFDPYKENPSNNSDKNSLNEIQLPFQSSLDTKL
jgi:zona occludens toxin